MSAVVPVPAVAPAVADPAAVTAYRWRWLALLTVLAAEVMDLLDATIINVAGPSIRAGLGASWSTVQWLSAGYTLAFAVGLVSGGRLGDVFGRRRMFLIGAAGFTLGSLACALSGSAELLVASRVVQGAFGALMIPQGLGIIRTVFPPEQLAAAFGLFGPVMGLSAVCGPILAGALIEADVLGAGWRMIFLVNLPIGLLAMVGAWRFFPATRAARGLRLDLGGMALVSVASFLALYPLVQGRELGWPAWSLGLLAAAVPALGLLAWHQRRRARRGAATLVELSLLAKRPFRAGLAVTVMFFAAMLGLMLVYGLYLQVGLGLGPLDAGLALVPWSIGVAVGAATSGGFLARRFGRRVMHAGLLVMIGGVSAFYLTVELAGAGVSALALAPAGALGGLGMGLLMAPLFDIALAGVEDHEVGSGSGVLTAVQQLGNALGAALIATLFFGILERDGGAGRPAPEVFASAFEATLGVVIALLVATFALTFRLPRRARADGAHA